jgi:cyclophilin family peptidyl-prolyl cis-trans isomerase
MLKPAQGSTEGQMSKNNNVNPGQYKVAGRERQGEDVVPQIEKAKLTKSRDVTAKKHKAPKKSR